MKAAYHNGNVLLLRKRIMFQVHLSRLTFNQRKFSVFQAKEIQRFLSEADDRHYLAAKVITVFGIYRATRGRNSRKLKWNMSVSKEAFLS